MKKKYKEQEENNSEENIAREPAPQYGADYEMKIDEEFEEVTTDPVLERVQKFAENIYISDKELLEQYPLTQEEIDNGLTDEDVKRRRKEFEKKHVEKLLNQPPLTQEEIDNALTGEQVKKRLHKFIDKLYNS
ncbi:MAG: hypothetical protein LUH22_00345 [Bacteroides sp.]|nr:hypothetical protein [Bacteroides sp.]